MAGKIKNYVLDTNILIHCPDSIFKFDDNNVYIMHTTVEELDGLKNASGETGYNAREAIRLINGVRGNGKLTNGALLPGGGKLFVYSSDVIDKQKLPDGWKEDKQDNLILLMVRELMEKKKNAILVTNDVAMMLKADILNIPVQNYRNDRVSSDKDFIQVDVRLKLRT